MVRKIKGLIALIIIAVVGWSAFWFAGSIAAEKVVGEIEQRSAARGDKITCNDRDISGYPFRMEVRCSAAMLSSVGTGLNASVNKVRSIALLYNPGHVIAEADGPLNVSLPEKLGVSDKIVATWNTARASVAAGLGGLERASVDSDDIKLVFEGPQARAPIGALNISRAQLHVRPNPEGPSDYDVAAELTDLFATRAGRDLPVMNASVLGKALGVGEALEYQPEQQFQNWLDNGGAFELTSLNFNSMGFSALASGLLHLSQTGLLSGQVDLEILEIDQLSELVVAIAPRFEANAAQMTTLLKNFSAGGETVKIALTVRDGIVSAGILPLGRIPALSF